MIQGRQLREEELQLLWGIDRRELINEIYYHEQGQLVARDECHDMRGWPPGECESTMPDLKNCYVQGGWFHGLFNDGQLVGASVLGGDFLHVSHTVRKRGLGKKLFELAKQEARARGATHLYISATPSENTVHFYQSMGCTLARTLDLELFKLEPLDIHLEFAL